MKEGISILGCGWLGYPLAIELRNSGHHIKGSKTTEKGIAQLTDDGIEGFKIIVKEDTVNGPIIDFLADSSILIIDIPPRLRSEPNTDFTKKIEVLLDPINSSKIEKVLFISSTSVYANKASIPQYYESSPTEAESESGFQLLKCEAMLQNQTKFATTVIRFGGLIGNDRHPATMLSGRKNVKNPEAPVNLIHQKDCISLIQTIIDKNAFGQTFNAVYPEHPKKSTYYTDICNKMNIEPPHFDHNETSEGKIISGHKVEEILKFNYDWSIY